MMLIIKKVGSSDDKNDKGKSKGMWWELPRV